MQPTDARVEAAQVLADEWNRAAAGCYHNERIARAEAARLDARSVRPVVTAAFGAPSGLESIRLRQRAAASGVRAWVLEMGAMLVLGPRLELLQTMASGVALVCAHDAVDGEACRCMLARSTAEGCIAEARRRGALEREDERRVAALPEVAS